MIKAWELWDMAKEAEAEEKVRQEREYAEWAKKEMEQGFEAGMIRQARVGKTHYTVYFRDKNINYLNALVDLIKTEVECEVKLINNTTIACNWSNPPERKKTMTMEMFNPIRILRLDDDVDIKYVSEYEHIGGTIDFIKFLAEPHLSDFKIRTFSIAACEDEDFRIDEWFDNLNDNWSTINKEAFDEIYKRASDI